MVVNEKVFLSIKLSQVHYCMLLHDRKKCKLNVSVDSHHVTFKVVLSGDCCLFVYTSARIDS